MAERVQIGGWLVAEAELQARWSRWQPLASVWLFRSPGGWTLVRMVRRVDYDDGDVPVDGSATVTAEAFFRPHRGGCLRRADLPQRVMDGGPRRRPCDDDLYRAWVPERIHRDFHEASIYNRDLAQAAGYLTPALSQRRAGRLPTGRSMPSRRWPLASKTWATTLPGSGQSLCQPPAKGGTRC